MKTQNYRDATGFTRSRGFIAAAAVCLIAVGAAAWVGLRSTDETKKPELTANNSSVAASSNMSTGVSSKPYVSSKSTSSRSTVSRQYSTSKADDTKSVPSTPTESAAAVVTPTATFFVMPITGDIVKPFSVKELQYSMTYGDWRLHDGIDIKGAIGDEIHAAGDGTVVAVSESATMGKTVEINHGNGIVAIYCGFKDINVKKGDTVKANDVIGTLGEIPCECVESVHLHFEVMKENTAIDPANIIGVNDDAAHGGK